MKVNNMNIISEKEKMLLSMQYCSLDEELIKLRKKCKKRIAKYNKKPNTKRLEKIFKQKLNNVVIEPPFYCDYGIYIELGENVFMNYNCIILDCAKVTIKENTLLGPNVQIYTALHPVNAEDRIKLIELAKPVTIGKNCWLGGSCIILPGVTIGDNCVIGAGSVVTKDIESNSVAVGNPCKVIKVLS